MATDRPRVVVVGAGLAGLSCADRLAPHVDVVVLEAQDRVGGRCWSSRGWPGQQVAEHGGELLEAGQSHVLALAHDLHLELEDRKPPTPFPGRMTVAGRRMLLPATPGGETVVDLLRDELAAVAGVTVGSADDGARALDEMSVQDWIDTRIDGGASSTLGVLLKTSAELNCGLPAAEMSALTMHQMMVGFDDDGDAFAFGNESSLRSTVAMDDIVRAAVSHTMHVKGGNDQLATGLADRLPAGTLALGSPVTEVRRRQDGRYAVASGTATFAADRVVLAAPLPALRQVDLEGAGLSALRHEAIASMGMGSHAKSLIPLPLQPASIDGWPGFSFSVDPGVMAWDSSWGQDGSTGLLTLFHQNGLPDLVEDGHGTATASLQAHLSGIVESLAPEVAALLTPRDWGRVHVDAWRDDLWTHGSYQVFLPGQYTRFAGFLSRPEGGVHFAGEHTSLSSPGYLDGAVASGLRAAGEVLASLGLAAS